MSFGQGGPGWGPGDSGTPDWSALAEESEAARTRKRRLMIFGGGGLAAVALAAVIAIAVAAQGGGEDTPNSLPTPEELPSSPTAPQPTFETKAPPPPPDPRDFITDPEKDTAPLSAKRLFPTSEVNVNGRGYLRRGTANTTSCDAAASGALSQALKANKCEQLHRATFVGGGRVVTVGVARFDSPTAAKKTADQASQITPLTGSGVSSFCKESACHVSANSYGRYAYFTIGGYINGKDVTASDDAHTSSRDLAKYAFQQIHKRGEDQADVAYAEMQRQEQGS